jgi:hypothetical protein
MLYVLHRSSFFVVTYLTFYSQSVREDTNVCVLPCGKPYIRQGTELL